MARNPSRNALFGVVLDARGLQWLDGGRTRARTWDPLIKSYWVPTPRSGEVSPNILIYYLLT
jgi:hypothetical protein